MLKFLLKYLKGKTVIIIIFVIISFVVSMMSIALSFYNGLFIDIITKDPNGKLIIEYATFIFVLTIISILISYFYNLISVKLKADLSFILTNNIINHIQKISFTEFKKYNTTYLNQRINTDVNKVWSFFFDYLINMLVQAVTLLILLCLLLYMNRSIFIIALIFIPIYILSYLYGKNPLYTKGLANKEEAAKYFKTLNEQLDLVPEIKSNSLYNSSNKRMEKGYRKYIFSLVSYSKTLYFVRSLDTFISTGAKVCTLLIGGFEIVKGTLSVGDYVIINSYFSMLFQCIKFYFSVGQDYQDTKNSYTRINDLMILDEDNNGEIYLKKIDTIELKNVKFKYKNQSNYLFWNLSYVFEKGNIYLITGDNGSGKSTLSLILLGILKSESNNGSITFNNINIENIDLIRLRRYNIGTYIQNTNMPDESVEDIINYFSNHDSVCISNNLLINDLNFLVNYENETFNDFLLKPIKNLSGGMKQKLLLFSILLKNSDVLILDEPSSSLDDTTTSELCKVLDSQKKNKIIIIVSHDKKVLANFNNYTHLQI